MVEKGTIADNGDKRKFYGQSTEPLDGLSVGRRELMEVHNLFCLPLELLENSSRHVWVAKENRLKGLTISGDMK